MPTKSEENKQVIQQLYDARGRGDTDALFASMHKSDPQERDRRLLRNMTFVASMGLAMVLAAMFTTILEWPDFWRNLLGDMYYLCLFVLCWGVSLGCGIQNKNRRPVPRLISSVHLSPAGSIFESVVDLGVLESKVVKVCIFSLNRSK